MCWEINGKKPLSRKVMRAQITVYKVVYNSTSGLLSPFRDFRYNFPETYQLNGEFIPVKNDSTKNWEISNGYHTYSLDCPYKDGVVRNTENKMLMDYSMFHLLCGVPVILECRIPKLARYYKNQNGEIVSDALETVAVYAEDRWNKRLKEIKEKKYL